MQKHRGIACELIRQLLEEVMTFWHILPAGVLEEVLEVLLANVEGLVELQGGSPSWAFNLTLVAIHQSLQ
jgi:hypothetical protein